VAGAVAGGRVHRSLGVIIMIALLADERSYALHAARDYLIPNA
jgi:hypothetical protein